MKVNIKQLKEGELICFIKDTGQEPYQSKTDYQLAV
jgi:hypothetical protein